MFKLLRCDIADLTKLVLHIHLKAMFAIAVTDGNSNGGAI